MDVESMDYYTDENCRIILGDCLTEMANLEAESIDLIVTSPPYNLGISTGGRWPKPGNKKGAWGPARLHDGYDGHDDALPYDQYVEWQRECLLGMWRLLKPNGAIFYNHKPRIQAGVLQLPTELNPGLPLRQIIIWWRRSGMNTSQGQTFFTPTHEWLLLIPKHEFRLQADALKFGDVWELPPDQGNPHPAPFPLGLATRAIISTDAQVILDPFVGSGTTLRAALDLGRQAIGIDKSREYAQMAVDRVAQCTLPF